MNDITLRQFKTIETVPQKNRSFLFFCLLHSLCIYGGNASLFCLLSLLPHSAEVYCAVATQGAIHIRMTVRRRLVIRRFEPEHPGALPLSNIFNFLPQNLDIGFNFERGSWLFFIGPFLLFIFVICKAKSMRLFYLLLMRKICATRRQNTLQ